MSAETWVAIFAALVASAALYFNWQSTRAADRAARAAEEQTGLQHQLRADAAQPYVWVDLRPDDGQGQLVRLVIGNSGPTVATNVRVHIDPPLRGVEGLQRVAESATRVLTSGLPSLPPGRTLAWSLGMGWDLLEADGPVYRFKIDADGPFGQVPTLTYVIDFSQWEHISDTPAGSLHVLTKAVNDLAKRLPQLE